jgi:GTPase SAR1 family protein
MSRSLDVDDVPYIKIALIGDSGVGKTTLVSVLATGCFESSPIYSPTYGCAIQILQNTHESQGQYFIELWDLGGNPRYKEGRPLCYDDCDGYIFLWDSSSEITYHSLQTWLTEVTQSRCRNSSSNHWQNPDEEDIITHEEGGNNKDNQHPLLIVGNKIDKLSNAEREALQIANEQQIFVVSSIEHNNLSFDLWFSIDYCLVIT